MHSRIMQAVGGSLIGGKRSIVEAISSRSFRKAWIGIIIIFFLAFVILPTVFVLTYAITDWSAIQDEVLSDPEVVNTIKNAITNSFIIATIVTVIDLIVGLPIAWMMVRKEFRGKRYLDTLMDMPLAFPTAALGFSIAIFWAMPVGIAQPPGSLGIITSPMLLVILLHVVFSYPYMVRSLSAILEQIDLNYEMAGRTLGASQLTAARTITLPLFRAGLVTGFILCFARSLSETGGTMMALAIMGAQDFFTGPTLIGTWKNAIRDDPSLAETLVPALSFVSILLIILALILLVLVKYVLMRVKLPFRSVWPRFEKSLSRGMVPRMKDGSAIIFFVIFVLIPSFFVFSYVFTGETGTVDWGGFTGALGYSFIVAIVVTVIDLALGIPLALYVARNGNGKVGQALDVLVNVPLIVPTAALGFSLGLFWANSPVEEYGMLLVILAHVAFTYPLVVRNVAGAVEEVDSAFEETARTLGARPIQTFRRVLFPMIKTAVLAGSIMAFTRSLGETGATIAVNPNANTVPIYIVNLIKAGSDHYYEAALACVALIIISYMAMLAIRYITRRNGEVV